MLFLFNFGIILQWRSNTHFRSFSRIYFLWDSFFDNNIFCFLHWWFQCFRFFICSSSLFLFNLHRWLHNRFHYIFRYSCLFNFFFWFFRLNSLRFLSCLNWLLNFFNLYFYRWLWFLNFLNFLFWFIWNFYIYLILCSWSSLSRLFFIFRYRFFIFWWWCFFLVSNTNWRFIFGW